MSILILSVKVPNVPLFIEAGTLTDMQHRPYSKDITLKFTATSGISGGDSETVF